MTIIDLYTTLTTVLVKPADRWLVLTRRMTNEAICLCSPKAEVRARAVERLVEYVDYARRLKAVLVVGLMQGLRNDEPNEALGVEWITHCLQEVAAPPTASEWACLPAANHRRQRRSIEETPFEKGRSFRALGPWFRRRAFWMPLLLTVSIPCRPASGKNEDDHPLTAAIPPSLAAPKLGMCGWRPASP